ncbi:MAG TPA: YifB family Mg chelatase-like AAA ATPase [Streptosporangiaceae bacterium]|nr:YifB family Mg chelatase-like AAA ATPase [Streptosporangiaceae bacterium]
MTLARVHSVALAGVHGHMVTVEADIANGLVGMVLVGLPDTALREARDRIRSAITNSGEAWPQRRITVGLSPASLPKRGSGFDLPIAVAVLAAAGALPAVALPSTVFLGELGLDGQVRPVRGVLPAVVAAASAGFSRVAVARANAREAALVPGVRVLAAPALAALLAFLRGDPPPAGMPAVEELNGGSAAASPQAAEPDTAGGQAAVPAGHAVHGRPEADLSEVLGQPVARRAAEICAAGGHHLSLIGPPGAGKTMVAERLPTILPKLGLAEALEVTSIHSVAGTLPPGCPLMTDPPFCGPHHTATKAAIVGGGTGSIHPGAVSLAHRGVLFLDEAPEFARDVLDALRQPLESGEVVVARSGATARFPARFTLVLAANPCPCARAGSPGTACSCTPLIRRRYLGRLSGPLLDRVDLKVELFPAGRAELFSDREFTEPSAVVADRVRQARQRAAHRLRGTPWRVNAEIPGSELRRSYAPCRAAMAPLERAVDLGQVSARGLDKIIRVSWTLADLAGKGRPTVDECGYALALWLGVAS